MPDINTLINEEISKIDLETIIKTEVNKSLEKLIKEKVADMFSTYGKIGKQVEEHLKNQLQIDLNKVQFEEHSKYVTDCVVEEIAKALHSDKESIKKLINTKVFEETRTEIPFKELKEEIRDLILDELNVEEGDKDQENGELEIEITKEKEQMSWSSSDYEKIKIKVGYESKDSSYTASLSNGIIYYHQGDLDTLKHFFTNLKYRGTKII